MDSMIENARIRAYNIGEIVFMEGEIPTHFFFLLEGNVRVYTNGNNFEEKTIHVFTQSGFIAEMPTLKQIPYPASAICQERSKIASVEYSHFKENLVNTEFCLSLIESLLNKITILENYIKKMEQPLETRFLNFLQNNKHILHNLTQREIAKTLNTTPESISRILKKLKQKGRVEVKMGKIIMK